MKSCPNKSSNLIFLLKSVRVVSVLLLDVKSEHAVEMRLNTVVRGVRKVIMIDSYLFPIQLIMYPRTYYPHAVANADELLQYYTQYLDWKSYPIRMFGKELLQPRLVSFYADE